MSFAPRWATVRHDGRLLVVRSPSLAACDEFLRTFAVDIWALARRYYQENDASVAMQDELLAYFAASPRSAKSLALCCQSNGWTVGDAEDYLSTHEAARQAVAACLPAVCDLMQLAQACDLDAVSRVEVDTPTPPPEISALELEVVTIAEHFGVSPREVWEWPFSGLLLLRDVRDRRQVAERTAGTASLASLPSGSVGE